MSRIAWQKTTVNTFRTCYFLFCTSVLFNTLLHFVSKVLGNIKLSHECNERKAMMVSGISVALLGC